MNIKPQNPIQSDLNMSTQIGLVTLGTQCTQQGVDKCTQTITTKRGPLLLKNLYSLSLCRANTGKVKMKTTATQSYSEQTPNRQSLTKSVMGNLETKDFQPHSYSENKKTPLIRKNENKLPKIGYESESQAHIKIRKRAYSKEIAGKSKLGHFMNISKDIDDQSDRGVSPIGKLVDIDIGKIFAKVNKSLIYNRKNELESLQHSPNVKSNLPINYTPSISQNKSVRFNKIAHLSLIKGKPNKLISPLRKPFIEWANSLFYYNVKNGVTAFNSDKSEDAYTHIEVAQMIKQYTNLDEKNAHPLQLKVLSTIKLLTNEMCIPEYYDQTSHLLIAQLLSMCNELFIGRHKVVALLLLISERELLVHENLTPLINLEHSDLSDKQKSLLCKYVNELGNINAKIYNSVQDIQSAHEFLDVPFYFNGIVQS